MNEPTKQPEHAGADAIKAGLPPAPPPTPAEQPAAYNPVSGWAIAGLAVSGFFALLVAVCTIVALTQGAPLFFPAWILVLAAAGLILSWIGQRHVQNSDGTRAGAKLATAGVWLSLVSGLGYLSYSYVTGLALENQANAFLMEKTDDDSGFFPRLREASEDPLQMNLAFLLTRPATDRGRARPDNQSDFRIAYDVPRGDGTPGELSQFREFPFARILFGEPGKNAEITPLAVQEWNYEQRRYKVVRNYRIKTKEGDFEFRLAVSSTEAESAGQGRKWFLNLRESPQVGRTLTKFGQGLGRLRSTARGKLYEWAFKPAQGPFKNIANIDKTAWDRLLPDDPKRAERRSAIHKLFADTEKLPQFQVLGREDDVGKWEEVGGKIRFYQGIHFILPREQNEPAFMIGAYVVLESAQAVNPEVFEEMSAPPEWNLVRVDFTSVVPITEKKAK